MIQIRENPMKKLITLFVLITPLMLNAQVPNQFSPGEIVSSSKVNANFAYLANMIGNDNVTDKFEGSDDMG